ncbi:hypothetical protein CkaCkLH20_11400 [Colletotrichum karsti]|uniref:Rhodopsin domain-containing protein n=1 Tax=Colletotrichum karsti TaxID=1095194 RepID=A0A9P6LFJ3_9PEZI|nr:uncharacterized protein CkaCkLH20_11400 [Colletotrichum karsti]KAF9871231.1 hypothetical protein CkaCkLH20_11400 [Colletotrichum karsti]
MMQMDNNDTLDLMSTGPPSGPATMGPLPEDNKQGLLIGIIAMFFTIVVTFMLIRAYVRGYVLKAWGLDDSFFIVSGFLIIAQGVAAVLNSTDGSLGFHIWDTSIPRLQKNGDYLMATVLISQVAFTTIKATFLLQYRRAFAIKSVRLFCDVFLLVSVVFLVGTLISGGIVIQKFLDDESTSGPFLIWGYTNAAVHFATDIIIFILPLPLVAPLQLATMQKVGLIASFAVGILTGAISVMKMVTLRAGIESEDSLYDAVPLVMISMAEPTCALMCACVPILRPLLCCSPGSRGSSRGSRKYSSKGTDSTGTAANSTATPSMPPQSPMNPSFPKTSRGEDVGGGVHGDLEGYLSTQQVMELNAIESKTPKSFVLATTSSRSQS